MTTMFSLEGRSAAVVGGGSGIGEAVAIGCAEAGAHVSCLDIDTDAAAHTAATIRAVGGKATSARLDILDGAAVTRAFEEITTARGSLDIVACTPGVNVRKPLLDYTDEEIDRVLGLNLKGGAHVIQAAGRIMSAQGSGSIILFSSIRSVVVEPGQSMYAATKAGIVQMVRVAAAELGPHGVRVNAVAPGVIDTPLTAPIKDNPGLVRRLCRAQHPQPLGQRQGDGRTYGLPRLGRRQLRDRDGPVRRRRLDRHRREVHAAGGLTSIAPGSRQASSYGIRQSLKDEMPPALEARRTYRSSAVTNTPPRPSATAWYAAS